MKGCDLNIYLSWGVYAPNYFTGLTVVNKAVSGRSARSYTREGKWAAVQALLKSGDFVVIEFGMLYRTRLLVQLLKYLCLGHNDGGSPSTSDRAAVVGEGEGELPLLSRSKI